jgi:hypothetical protein
MAAASKPSPKSLGVTTFPAPNPRIPQNMPPGNATGWKQRYRCN